jgi:DNA-binding transcriptional LysR family regulator
LPRPPDGCLIQQIMHEPLLVCVRANDPLAQCEEIPPALLNGKLAIFSDPQHHPLAHERLLEMLAEQGIQSCISNPTFNADHLQWMVHEGYCLALIPKNGHLHEDLVLRPIQGVAWTIDSAVVYRPESNQKALPVLLRDLERRFSVPAQKKPPRPVKPQTQQEQLPFTPSSRKRSK